MESLKTEYRFDCGYEWSTPVTPHKTDCPKCGSKYYKWTNFEKDFKK